MLEISRFRAERRDTALVIIFRGSPRFLGGSPTSPLKCLGAPRGRFSLPRKRILGSMKSGCLLCLFSLPGLICLIRLLCLLRGLSIFCFFACYDCCADFLVVFTVLALLSLRAFLMCLGPRILTSLEAPGRSRERSGRKLDK